MSSCSCSVWKEIYKVFNGINGWINHCQYHMNSPQDQSLKNQLLPFLWKSDLKNGAWNEVLLEEGFGRHVVHDGGGQVGQDAVHGVPRLLSETRWWSWIFGYRCSTFEELQWPGISRLTFEVVKIPGNPEVLLKWSRQWRKDGLGGLVAVKGGGGPWVVTIFTIVSMWWWCGRRWWCYHDQVLSMWGNIDDGHANFLMQRI